MAGCKVAGCRRLAVAWGWCDPHYRRQRKHGDPGPALVVAPMRRPCNVEDCDRLSRARGLCEKHYQRWQSHGDPAVCGQGGRPMRGAEHGKWSGDTPSYTALHRRLRAARGKARTFLCEGCGEAPASEWAYDHEDDDALLSEDRGAAYSADLGHYLPLCLPCHRAFDSPLSARRAAG